MCVDLQALSERKEGKMTTRSKLPRISYGTKESNRPDFFLGNCGYMMLPPNLHPIVINVTNRETFCLLCL